MPHTAIAPATSSQTGSTPTPGIASMTSPGNIFALFTSSRHVVGSRDASIAALAGATLLAFAASGDPLRVQYAGALALMCGLRCCREPKTVAILFPRRRSSRPGMEATSQSAPRGRLQRPDPGSIRRPRRRPPACVAKVEYRHILIPIWPVAVQIMSMKRLGVSVATPAERQRFRAR